MNQYVTMKQLPESEQPYERCEKMGASSLSDAQLLAVILRSGTANLSSLDVALKLLNYGQKNKGLLNVSRMTQKELMSIPGIGKVKAITLLCVMELCNRITKAVRKDAICMQSPDSIAMYYMQEMRSLKVEQVRVLFFDTKNRLLGEKVISTGSVNASILSPREIYLAAFEHEAVNIILLHNHPSGDPTPSREDLMVTKRMKEAGSFIGITLLDHIIIGDNQYISFKEQEFI